MDTKPLEKFAQTARRQLHEQVRARLEQVLRTDSPELRAQAPIVAELNKQIAQSSRQAVVEQVAYTWFNRFCALRYMDANHYTRMGVVSPAAGFTQPEMLQEAKAGHIDPDLAPFVDSQRVFDLLSGRRPSPDAQQEAYRLLLVGSCNQYHAAMPFLFEAIDDYTELLMPDDLLSASSVLTATRDTLTAETCQDVEVIGWLYQFYISEKKDAVIGAKKAITPENIPAATQLFTPHWIVRYLVENSLGRLWLHHRPSSRLAEKMEFYIAPDTDQTLRVSETLRVSKPEDLTICDPAVGSGHMLTYAFDLLVAIYEEEGYNPPDIPRLILQHNLTGLEIDERAAALAAFALTMKARARDRRFFRRGVAPNVTTLRPVTFTEAELDAEVAALLEFVIPRSSPPVIPRSSEESHPSASAKDSSSKTPRNDMVGALREDLRHDLALFREADNVGSLLRPLLSVAQLTRLRDHLNAATPTGQLQLFDRARRKKALQAITQAIPLARQYDVVIANPPYLGNFDDRLKKFAKDNYPDSKSDLFAMFMERNLDFTLPGGLVAMVNMQSWMFLSSYEKLREKLLNRYAIVSMAHIGARGFDSIGGEVVSTTAFVLENAAKPESNGAYVRLVDGRSEAEKASALREAIQNPDCGYFYRAAATDFKKIPGSPIAYWLNESIKTLYEHPLIGVGYEAKEGVGTRNDEVFMRMFWEVSQRNISREKRWILTDKAGDFRRWYMGFSYLMDWENDGYRIKNYRNEDGSLRSRPQNTQYLFEEGVSWGKVGSGIASFRWRPKGFGFNDAAPTLFGPHVVSLLAPLNSCVTRYLLTIRGSTLNITTGVVKELPNLITSSVSEEVTNALGNRAILLALHDWDAYETSWDFTTLPLVAARQSGATLAAAYAALRQQWQAATLDMQRLEEENNRLFITAYGLQEELTPDVPLSEITLTCNPHYRYNANKPSEELEALLLADTMREFISYAVGCMFGRYSLDAPGLILANQGETFADYVRIVDSGQLGVDSADNSQLSTPNYQLAFLPDKDNAIPMLDGDWFSDDVTERFKKFLRITFGETHYEDNLAFIEAALGRDIRSYFLREFYDHHVKMYKKRPIYWLFSSAKGSFNVLIYMHRYRPDTVSVVLNDYLREFRAKLNARKSHLEGVSISTAATPRDKTRALKEIADIDKTLKEIREYEDDVLYPLATRQVQIDLDDGVKVNYNKFGQALKKVTGLSEN